MFYRSNEPNLRLLKNPYVTLVSFVFFFLLVFCDITSDVIRGASIQNILIDILIEGLVIFTASLSLISLTLRYIEERDHRLQASNELLVTNLRHQDRMNSTKDNLVMYVHKKFAEWGLTKTEQDVAMHILQGYDAKAIADLRFTSEKTVKNQFQNIYNKTNLGGRTELMAYFLQYMLETNKETNPPSAFL